MSCIDLDESGKTIKELGKGNYGTVYLIWDEKTNQNYVRKTINLSLCSLREKKGAELEIKLLSTLRHPNIVRYKGSSDTSDGRTHIYMEYCVNGDLYRHIKVQNGAYFSERDILDWFIQICLALQYLHDRNILHRDLKTQNIFLTKDYFIKVGDFGIARILESTTDMATTLIGTPYYMSPEIFCSKPYNHKSDIWALGCCLYELCTLRHAFNAKDMSSLMCKVLKGKVPPIPRLYNNTIWKIVVACLQPKPEKRPSVNKLLRHPFLKQHIISFLKSAGRDVGACISNSASCEVLDRCNESDAVCPAPLKLPALLAKHDHQCDMNFNETLLNCSRKRMSSKHQMLRNGCSEEDSVNPNNIETCCSSYLLNNHVRASSAPSRECRRKKMDRQICSAGPMKGNDLQLERLQLAHSKLPKLDIECERVAEAMEKSLHISSQFDDELPPINLNNALPAEHDCFKRAALLKRQCSIRLSRQMQEKAYALMDKAEGKELEESLRELLKDDYNTYAPLLTQLKMYEDIVVHV